MFFRFTTAGESHGKALVAIVEGLPAGLEIDIDAIDHELWRRQQGYGRGGRMKIESDTVEIVSGIRHGKTLGSPVTMTIENKDFVHWQDVMAVQKPDREGGLHDIQKSDSVPRSAAQPDPEGASLQKPARSKGENEAKNAREVKRPRPGHADLAGGQKFGARDLRNILERASARETAARVACGALAKQLLAAFGIEIKSHVVKLGSVPESPLDKSWYEVAAIPEDSPLNCADENAQTEMIALIDQAKENGDTLGGIFEVVAKGVPVGLGSHTSWNEKLDGRIAQAFMSIHAIKAVEIGTGVSNAGKFGSEVHDEIYFEPPSRGDAEDGTAKIRNPQSAIPNQFVRRTNRAGGLEGGITNGEELRVRGYMKPISTLRKPLHSVDIDTKEEDLAAFERSDITAVPAAGVIGESMLAIVLANSMREKFGGDSLDEMRRNFATYVSSINEY